MISSQATSNKLVPHSIVLACAAMLATWTGLAHSDEPREPNRDLIKVAAVQINGYDKGDLRREDYDPTAQLIPYIDRAGRDDAELAVFPEYVLGRISVPGPQTQRIAAAAKANSIYVERDSSQSPFLETGCREAGRPSIILAADSATSNGRSPNL